MCVSPIITYSFHLVLRTVKCITRKVKIFKRKLTLLERKVFTIELSFLDSKSSQHRSCKTVGRIRLETKIALPKHKYRTGEPAHGRKITHPGPSFMRASRNIYLCQLLGH